MLTTEALVSEMPDNADDAVSAAAGMGRSH
jgi:hypothetical protein